MTHVHFRDLPILRMENQNLYSMEHRLFGWHFGHGMPGCCFIVIASSTWHIYMNKSHYCAYNELLHAIGQFYQASSILLFTREFNA